MGTDDEDIINEYKRIIDIFIEEKTQVFVFETMSNPYQMIEAINYLREKQKDVYIVCQFAVGPDGYTKNSISVKTIAKVMSTCDVDTVGLNCAADYTYAE